MRLCGCLLTTWPTLCATPSLPSRDFPSTTAAIDVTILNQAKQLLPGVRVQLVIGKEAAMPSPSQARLPWINSRPPKDFQVNPKYTVRLPVSGYYLTNHFNPEAVHTNTGDSACGFFFGRRGRRFTAEFDALF